MIKGNGGKRIGSTFAGVSINRDNANVTNIGDSRVYHFRNGVLKKISRDHTPIQQMIDHGVLTAETARTHPDRHTLTQHIGISPLEMVIEPYSMYIQIEKNDMFLICSDGLTDMLDDSIIKEVIDSSDSLEVAAEALYEKSIQNGGKDNITIVLVQIQRGGQSG